MKQGTPTETYMVMCTYIYTLDYSTKLKVQKILKYYFQIPHPILVKEYATAKFYSCRHSCVFWAARHPEHAK